MEEKRRGDSEMPYMARTKETCDVWSHDVNERND
jgi:hypothetical protein